jgi:hypothetical protein
VAAWLAACGTGGEAGGPPQNTPVSGATGYDKVDGTYVLVDSNADLTQPTVVADSPEGPFALWFTYSGVEIRRSDLPALGKDATPPRPALAALEPFEGGVVQSPSVERLPDGRYQMLYQAAVGLIAMAESEDGESWTNRRVVGSGNTPSLASGRIFYERDGMIELGGEPLLRGISPDVHLRATAGGRPMWQMFFNCPGRDGISVAICFAGSFDGEHFMANYTPVLAPDAPDELGPAQVGGIDRAVLFFAQLPIGGRFRIGAARAPAP